ncbi:MAG: phosphatidylglycerophosphatase A [Deltaproteobacteria bacterium]|nr:MAG: phosphatidylglycerophosphatase A [Deltaproteobacteria bacterium]
MNIATLWIAGRGPKAPGTWGTLAAMCMAPWLFMPLSIPCRLALLAAIFIVGSIAASRVEILMGQKDPGCVVIDELLGLWICYGAFPTLSLWQLCAGFVFFRMFDIVKPWPLRAAETWLPNGWSVMLDDALAGIYAAICLWAVCWIM